MAAGFAAYDLKFLVRPKTTWFLSLYSIHTYTVFFHQVTTSIEVKQADHSR
jgi:hypothetical protein